MEFSPPYAEVEPSALDSGRDRQNTNVDQNLNNQNMRTGTLWFNPPNNGIISSNPDLGLTNDNNPLAATGQV